jgi:hypothetical protein
LQVNRNWNKDNDRKEFFNSLKAQLDYKNLDDFYNISSDEIYQSGGKGLLEKMWGGSLWKTLQFLHPNHTWLPWRFTQNVPKGYWDKQEHQQSFFTWLGGQLGMNHMDDWYRVTKKAIETNGGGSLLDKYGSSPSKLLELGLS